MAAKEKDPTQGMSQAVADQVGQAMTRKLEAETRAAEAGARTAELTLYKAEEAERERRTLDRFQHIYVFDDPVTDATVLGCILVLDTWRRLEPGCDITIRFYSPGGDVIAGMYLFDYLMGLRRDGHRLTTEAYGYAASMAGILLQAGTVRTVGKESYVLIHEIQTAVRGKIGEIDDEVEFMHKIADRVLTIFAARAKEAGDNGTASQPLTKVQFKKRWTRKDWWLTSDEALKYGVVDEVR